MCCQLKCYLIHNTCIYTYTYIYTQIFETYTITKLLNSKHTQLILAFKIPASQHTQKHLANRPCLNSHLSPVPFPATDAAQPYVSTPQSQYFHAGRAFGPKITAFSQQLLANISYPSQGVCNHRGYNIHLHITTLLQDSGRAGCCLLASLPRF